MLIVADNLQITHPLIQQAVRDTDPLPIQELVVRLAATGAEAIDINSGPLTRDPEKKMSFLVDAVTAVTDLPLFLDTSNPRALEAGLIACLRKSKMKPVINGFSLEPTKREYILPLAARYQVDIIGYLLDQNSHVPHTLDERLAIALELFGTLEAAGVAPEQLIIDPVVAPLMWENGKLQNQDLLQIIRHLPDLLGFPVRTIASLSNLTTGRGPQEKKESLEQAYLPMLAAAGLSLGLMNVFHPETLKIAQTSQLLLSPGIFSYAEMA